MLPLVKLFYLRNESNAPVACVASARDAANQEKIVFTVATHNPIDPFNKAFMRSLALERLVLKPFSDNIHRVVTSEVGNMDTKEKIVSTIAYTNHKWNDETGEHLLYPSRAQRVARLWLKNTVKKEAAKRKPANVKVNYKKAAHQYK